MTDADLVARAKRGDHAAFGELVDRHRLPAYRAAMAVLGSHAEADDAAQDAFVLAWRRLDSFRGDASFRTWLLRITWHQAINRRRGPWRWWKRTVPLDEEALSRLRSDSSDTVRPGYVKRTARGAGTDVVTDAGTEAGTAASTNTAANAGAQRRSGPYAGDAPITPSVSPGTSQAAHGLSDFNRTAGRTPEQLASSRELRRDIVKAIRALSPKLRDTLLLTRSGEYTYEEIGTLLRAPVGTIKWRVAEARRLVKKRLQELGHGELE